MAAPNQRLTGQNPPLSDSDIRRVSQTDGLQRLTVRRLTISRGPHPIFAGLYRPTFGVFIVLDLWLLLMRPRVGQAPARG
jgi:hypothetical protein